MGKNPVVNEYDIAIVGGGIAGLYTAFRLKQAWLGGTASRTKICERLGISAGSAATPIDRRKLRVILLEKDALRLGGRLRDVELPFPGGGVISELGAMRFSNRHKLLNRLLAKLRVCSVPFADSDFSTEFFLRGKHFSVQDIQNSTGNVPYRLAGAESGKTPDELVLLAVNSALKELTLNNKAKRRTRSALEKLHALASEARLKNWQWDKIRKHGKLTGKVDLSQIGMWNLIHHHLSSEGALFVEDGMGYDSIIGNWNVSDAIPWFLADFAPGQSYLTAEEGFEKVVDNLLDYLKNTGEHRAGFEFHIQMNTEVKRIETHSPQTMHISAARTSDIYKSIRAINHSVIRKECYATFVASAVVLALPKAALADLSLEVSSTHEKKWKANLKRVRPHRLMKIALGFREAWWKKRAIPCGSAGKVLTDLPLRQMYFFDRQWLEKRGRYRYYDENGKTFAPSAKPSAAQRDFKPEIEGIVMAYLDGRRSSFWHPILAVPHEEHGASGHNVDELISGERRERKLLGKRIWEWNDTWQFEQWEKIRELFDKEEVWSEKELARFLYFFKDGIHHRLSTKFIQMMQKCFNASQNVKSPVPGPIAGAYAFWHNFGSERTAGWHTWEPGVISKNVIKYMSRPFGRKRIYVCGEAFSSEQGWIEGALKSAEIALHHLGVALPNGVSRDYVGIV